MRKIGAVSISCFLIAFLAFQLIKYYNLSQLSPDSHEISRLREFYGNLAEIKDSTSLLKAQKYTIEQIEHRCIQDEKSLIIIDSIIIKKAGFCYDRSILLQKLLLMNGIEVRPIFIYFTEKEGGSLSFFNKKLSSHNIFEAKIKNKWVVVQTNFVQNRIKDLQEYIREKKSTGQHPHYIKNLNNRHGGFISPSWIPDIY